MASEMAFAGDFFIFLGVTSMIILSIAAYIALVLLLLFASTKNGGGNNIFCFCGGSSSGGGSHYGGYYSGEATLAFIIVGLIVSAIVVGLALHMGLPVVALGFGVAWCAAFSSVMLGFLLRAGAEAGERASVRTLNAGSRTENGATMYGDYSRSSRYSVTNVYSTEPPAVAVPI